MGVDRMPDSVTRRLLLILSVGWRIEKLGWNGAARPAQSFAFGVTPDAADVKMKSPNSFRGIENLQASALSFPRETIVAARNAEMEAAVKLTNGGLKNPSVLAERVIEQT